MLWQARPRSRRVVTININTSFSFHFPFFLPNPSGRPAVPTFAHCLTFVDWTDKVGLDPSLSSFLLINPSLLALHPLPSPPTIPQFPPPLHYPAFTTMNHLDTSWCPVCSRQILPKRYLVPVTQQLSNPTPIPGPPPSSPIASGLSIPYP